MKLYKVTFLQNDETLDAWFEAISVNDLKFQLRRKGFNHLLVGNDFAPGVTFQEIARH